MPNTLAHIGVQSLTTKFFYPAADIKWIALGCIIPDLPWISQRVASILLPVNPIDLRVYCMIQASLFFCMILSCALAMFAENAFKIFLILASNSFMHLLLDALQTKWANGVHLLAPLNWRLTEIKLFWPESFITLVLTGFGFCLLLFYGWLDRNHFFQLIFSRYRFILSLLLMAFYLLLPNVLFQGPFSADNHYVQTLLNNSNRAGKEIGFDRCYYDKANSEIIVFTGERFKIINYPPIENGKISLFGTFVDNRTIDIKSLHLHGKARDFYSYTGLLTITLLWTAAFFQNKIINHSKL